MRLLTSCLTLVGVLALSGCVGDLGGTPGSEESKEKSPAGVVGEDDIPAPGTRFRRLSHDQWQMTAADLFQVDAGPVFDAISGAAANFRADPVQGGFIFDASGDALEVDSTLWSAYQRAAADIAAAVVSDSVLFSELVPAGASDEERAEAFIQSFGALVHRRPLTGAQLEEYRTLYQAGTSAYLDHTGLEGGVRLVIESLLQSPYFLYRIEASDKVDGGVVPLDGYERASRLSYFFWGTMPDAELFEAAAAGDLDSQSGVRAQAQRLVSDARARDTVVHFFEKVLEVERYESAISPSPSAFPDVSDSLPASAHGETTRFLEAMMYEQSGSLRDLMTSTTTYVDDELAAIYGLDGAYDDSFQKVQLDGSQRSGIFTQIGFLAANATSADPDPIHRGVFLARRVSCIHVSAPPDEVPPLPTPNGQSNRQLVEEHTEAEGTTCRNCHTTIINPFGFAYEHYDAIGAFRTQDGPHQVNAATEVMVDDGMVAVNNAVDLADVLASSQGVHECFAGHLIAFAQGRNTAEEDEALKKSLGSTSLDSAVSFRDLMVEVAVAVSFLNRSAEAE